MHVIFIPYGIKDLVEVLFRDMQAQKFTLKLYSPDGKTTKEHMIQGSLRMLPFGFWEYVFPKEHLDCVMTTLNFNEPLRYPIPDWAMKLIKKTLKVEDIPKKFDTSKKFPWIKEHVNIIPIGIRKDAEGIKEPVGEWEGWTHEAI